MKIEKLYKVDWIDSANHAIGWEFDTNIELAMICSIGFLAAKNKIQNAWVQWVAAIEFSIPNDVTGDSIATHCYRAFWVEIKFEIMLIQVLPESSR